MRRKDREIVERDVFFAIMRRCDVCRVGLNDPEGYPYILPLNFGMDATDDAITLYFHGATEGRKYELLALDNRVSFEMDCGHTLMLDEVDQNCTMAYESVMGRGTLEILPEEEKLAAICVLMGHYRAEDFPYNPASLSHTAVMRLRVESVTAKHRRHIAPERLRQPRTT